MVYLNSTDSSDIQSQLTSPFVPPTLRDDECYHVFLSYSSTDYKWTHSLLDKLESIGLKVCYHERDFVPGRTVLENMSECIQESQKVLLVLSPEFVRSRWCLLEANMSLFRDCLERKPIVPVLLDPDISVPLHLCHLTYIEARHPDFMNKLLKVLCTPNRELRGSTVVPYQPPSVYNGKALQPLTAANEETLYSWDAGVFSDMDVPDQLRLIIQDQDHYQEALRIINSVAQTQVWLRPLWKRVLVYAGGFIFFLSWFSLIGYITSEASDSIRDLHFPIPFELFAVGIIFLYVVPFGILIQLCLWKRDDKKRILRELQKAVGQANVLLSKEKVLMGCRSNSKLYLVYVSLDGCRQEFTDTFSEQACCEDMFHRALLYFSSGYTCCLSKRHFPFSSPPSTGHLPGAVCFCQYVCQQLEKGQWLDHGSA